MTIRAAERPSYGQSAWTRGHVEGQLILPEEELSAFSSSRTVEDIRSSFVGDEVDSSAWAGLSGDQSFRGASKDFITDGSPDGERSTGVNSGSFIRKTGVTYVDASRASSGEGGVEMIESLSQGGGAFMPFRKDSAKQPSTTSPQHTMVPMQVPLNAYSDWLTGRSIH